MVEIQQEERTKVYFYVTGFEKFTDADGNFIENPTCTLVNALPGLLES